MRPHATELGRVPGTDYFADAIRHPANERIPGVFIFRNDGAVPTLAFKPGDLVVEASGVDGTPVYVNTADASIYIGLGGTMPPIGAGASVTIPVEAQQIGSAGSAGVNEIDVVVTQSYGTLSATASTLAIGQEREGRDAYISRCEIAADKLAAGGPTQAYRFAMNTRLDGLPLQRFDGSGPVTITQAYISESNADNEVTIYFGGEEGEVDDIDVSSVTGEDRNPHPVGCKPGTVLLLPTTNDPNITPANTPGGASCTNTVVRVAWFAKVKRAQMGSAGTGTYATPWIASTAYSVGQKVGNGTKVYVCTVAGTSASSGGPTGTGTGISDGGVTWNFDSGRRPDTTATTAAYATVQTAIATYLLSTGIGGLDQSSGAGFVYTTDLVPAVKDSIAGLYDTLVAVPATASTAIAIGHIATIPDPLHKDVQGTITGVLVIT